MLAAVPMVTAVAEATPVVILVAVEVMLTVFMVEVVLVFSMVAAMLFFLFMWCGRLH